MLQYHDKFKWYIVFRKQFVPLEGTYCENNRIFAARETRCPVLRTSPVDGGVRMGDDRGEDWDEFDKANAVHDTGAEEKRGDGD